MLFCPLIKVPVAPNPTVESTDITLPLTETSVSAFVLPGTVKTPSIKSRSLNPTNKEIL